MPTHFMQIIPASRRMTLAASPAGASRWWTHPWGLLLANFKDEIDRQIRQANTDL